MEKKVYISVGTNLGERKKNIDNAYRLIEERISKITCFSSVYSTKPWGFDAEMDFYNTVITLKTQLTVLELLHQLQEIEKYLGRIKSREKSYISRLIDLDILDYNGEIINEQGLILPHERITERNFVLIPLAEVNPAWIHPVLKVTVERLVSLSKDNLEVRKIILNP